MTPAIRALTEADTEAVVRLSLRAWAPAGCRLAAIGTGGDPGHAPARRAYEKAGFTAMPQVRYYKAL